MCYFCSTVQSFCWTVMETFQIAGNMIFYIMKQGQSFWNDVAQRVKAFSEAFGKENRISFISSWWYYNYFCGDKAAFLLVNCTFYVEADSFAHGINILLYPKKWIVKCDVLYWYASSPTEERSKLIEWRKDKLSKIYITSGAIPSICDGNTAFIKHANDFLSKGQSNTFNYHRRENFCVRWSYFSGW